MTDKKRVMGSFNLVYIPVLITSAISFKNPDSLKPLLSKPSCDTTNTHHGIKETGKRGWRVAKWA